MLLPLRENAVAVAKQAASLNELSSDRLSLGVGLGGRDDDYEVASIATSDRGERMTEMLARMREVWDDPQVGPDSSPELIVGGGLQASFERAARYGDGWTAGGSPPEQVKAGREAVVDSAATDADTVKAYLAAYEEAGADELFFFPTNPDPEQVDLLAEAALRQPAQG